jgi:hypothetical protein
VNQRATKQKRERVSLQGPSPFPCVSLAGAFVRLRYQTPGAGNGARLTPGPVGYKQQTAMLRIVRTLGGLLNRILAIRFPAFSAPTASPQPGAAPRYP